MSIADAYDHHDAIGLAELVRRGEVTADELLDEALRRVDERNPAINAIVNVFEGRARAAIGRGLPDGPLRGVPFVLKDLGVDLAGEITTSGSRYFADYRPQHTSEIVRRYEAAGLVVFGKTNTPEMGLNPSTEPVLFGPTRNPWNLDHSAGGSSGGAAAAVAAGVLPAAHATDGGGSIRIPASMCGLFGLKPNRARTPIGPPLGEGWNGLSHGHVVTWSVRDSAALLDATAGSSIGEPYAAPHTEGLFLAATKRSPGALRIRFITAGRDGLDVDRESINGVAFATRLLLELGHDVEPIDLDVVDWPALMSAFGILSGTNVAATVAYRAAELGRDPGPDDLENMTHRIVALSSTRGAVDYAQAIQTMHRVGRAVGEWFTQFDILMTPTVGVPPPRIGVMSSDTDDITGWGNRASTITNFLSLFNATGQPAMSLPLHHTADGLPMGVQFVGPLGSEALLYSLAAQIEVAAPWRSRRPASYTA